MLKFPTRGGRALLFIAGWVHIRRDTSPAPVGFREIVLAQYGILLPKVVTLRLNLPTVRDDQAKSRHSYRLRAGYDEEIWLR